MGLLFAVVTTVIMMTKGKKYQSDIKKNLQKIIFSTEQHSDLLCSKIL